MIKRLFWLALGLIIARYVSRQEMDELYGEISQLREAENQRETSD